MDPSALRQTFAGIDLGFLGPKQSGKVRDIYARDDHLVLITTDRLSAFDHILGLVPFKGQVLNQLAAFWFEQTGDIVSNHFVEAPDPNVTIGRKCRPLPVEVVVRGYISGVTTTSLWYRYSQGERNIYGMDFPDGLRKNDPLPQPIITPTTKAEKGGHDERITSAEIVEQAWSKLDCGKPFARPRWRFSAAGRRSPPGADYSSSTPSTNLASRTMAN